MTVSRPRRPGSAGCEAHPLNLKQSVTVFTGNLKSSCCVTVHILESSTEPPLHVVGATYLASTCSFFTICNSQPPSASGCAHFRCSRQQTSAARPYKYQYPDRLNDLETEVLRSHHPSQKHCKSHQSTTSPSPPRTAQLTSLSSSSLFVSTFSASRFTVSSSYVPACSAPASVSIVSLLSPLAASPHSHACAPVAR